MPAVVSRTVNKSGVRFPAVRDRRLNFSLAPEKDQVFTEMWEKPPPWHSGNPPGNKQLYSEAAPQC